MSRTVTDRILVSLLGPALTVLQGAIQGVLGDLGRGDCLRLDIAGGALSDFVT